VSLIRKNFLYNSLLSVSQVLFPLIIFAYAARIINPEGIGKVSFVESICRYVMLIAALGIPIYGVREIAKVKDDKIKLNTIFNEIVSIHIVISVVISLIYLAIVFFVQKFNNELQYYLLGLVMIFANVFTVEWYFQGTSNFKFITLRTVFVRLFSVILLFFIVTKPEHEINFFVITIITLLLNSVINFWYASKSIKFRFRINILVFKKHFKPLLLIFSSTVSISIYVLLDTILLGFLSDEKAVGLYSIALKISKIPMLFVGALGLVLIPQLSYSFVQNDLEKINVLISKSINFVITFSLPIIFLIFGLSTDLILLIFGEKFIVAADTLKILSCLVLLIGLSNIFGLQILTPMGKDKYLTFSVLFGTILSLTLNFVLIPIYQDKGAAIATVITELAVVFSTFYFANKFLRIAIDYRFFMLSFLFSTPFYLITMLGKIIQMNKIAILIPIAFLSLIYFIIMQLYIVKNQMMIEIKNKLKHKIWPNTII
jgi:O-antigen/teichoic acid export membrane protein